MPAPSTAAPPAPPPVPEAIPSSRPPAAKRTARAAHPHGHLFAAEAARDHLPEPQLVSFCEQENRHGNGIPAHEFMDTPEVLDRKMALVADLLRKSRYTSVYAGAGLSRACGIPDYATPTSLKSVVTAGSGKKAVPKLQSNLAAQPSFSHYAITALHKAKLVTSLVQQNHDGIPQKAGFPQTACNEIHGAWMDPSNPVVPFSGNLRSDLFEDLLEIERQTDLTLCVGTSLSGMNADRIVETPAKRSLQARPTALGSVIINLQQTRLDSLCAVRVFAKLDDAFAVLLKHLQIADIPQTPLPPPSSHLYTDLPYDKTGKRNHSMRMTLDLRQGARVAICVPEASNYRTVGTVVGCDYEGNYAVQLDRRRLLGRWWLSAAQAGHIERLPLINVNPVVVDAKTAKKAAKEAAQKKKAKEQAGTKKPATSAADETVAASASSAPSSSPASSPSSAPSSSPAAPSAPPPSSALNYFVDELGLPPQMHQLPPTLSVVQTHAAVSAGSGNTHRWTLELEAPADYPLPLSEYIAMVEYELHPTFSPPTVAVTTAPFRLQRTGWGEFEVTVRIHFQEGYGQASAAPLVLHHPLTFADERSATVAKVPQLTVDSDFAARLRQLAGPGALRPTRTRVTQLDGSVTFEN